MKQFLIKLAITRLIKWLTNNLDVDLLLEEVAIADRQYDRAFSRKGHVYRFIKKVEGDQFSQAVANLLVELAVVLFKEKF